VRPGALSKQPVTFPRLLSATAVIAIAPAVASAQSTPAPPPEEPAVRWSMTLGGGALAPVGDMRDGYQDALVAGLRLGVRARIGIGLQLAVDYSPLPRRMGAGAAAPAQTFDTSYGTVGLMPAWTIGHGVLRVHLGAGGGLAIEHTSITMAQGQRATSEDARVPAALGQVGLELHVSSGGGLILLAGGTKTFGDRDYQYAWGMGGLTLDF